MASSLGTLGTLLKRLEAATSRLEDIALAQNGQQQLYDAVTLDDDSPQAQSKSQPQQQAPVAEEKKEVEKEANPLEEPLAAYVAASEKVHPILLEQARAVATGFKAQHDIVLLSKRMAQPDKNSPEYAQLLAPLIEAVTGVQSFLSRRPLPPRELDNHLKAVAESFPLLSWVSLQTPPDKPMEYVAEMIGTAQFYTNRILSNAKNDSSLSAHAEWANSHTHLLKELLAYVRNNYPRGLVYNPKGITLSDALKEMTSASPPNDDDSDDDDSPPPVPKEEDEEAAPPPPPAKKPSSISKPPAKEGDMSAVFADINQGGLASRLRKVDKSEMTHKNPSLRANVSSDLSPTTPSSLSSTSPSSSKRPAKPPKPASFTKKNHPKLYQDGSKWIVENYENDHNIVIEEKDLHRSHSVNIFGCKNSTIQIKGKVNVVMLVSCTKTSVLLESLVSSLNVTSCPNFTIQILGTAPSIQIDSSDYGALYLSKDCLDSEIYTSKCNTINISVPRSDDQNDPDYAEYPLPEMFKTVITKDRKIETSVVPID